MEFARAIAPVEVLHREIREGGVERQLDGVAQTRAHVGQGGSLKYRGQLLAPPQATHGDDDTQEEGTRRRELLG